MQAIMARFASELYNVAFAFYETVGDLVLVYLVKRKIKKCPNLKS